jgi:DNA (cytosine-5)-methyltransferase 1
VKPRALDLFCGAGGATKGLQMAGFHVTGIDNRPQPRYCGDEFILADALRPPVRLEAFDLIWASPPCQGYSRTRHLPWLKGKKHPLLIDPVRAMFRGLPCLTVIENVEGAPLESPIRLRGGYFGLPYRRLRLFEANFYVMTPTRSPEPVGISGPKFGGRLREQHQRMSRWERCPASMRTGDGMPWMRSKEASQAIPPAYSHHIGTYALMALEGERKL